MGYFASFLIGMWSGFLILAMLKAESDYER